MTGRSPERALIEGLGLYLESLGLGVWTVPEDGDPDQPYPAGATAIVANSEPADPLNCIVLNVTVPSHNSVNSESSYGFQVRCRLQSGDPLAIDDMAHGIWDALHSLCDTRLPSGFRVGLLTHRSGTSLETNRDDLWWRSDNYQVTTNVPSRHRA